MLIVAVAVFAGALGPPEGVRLCLVLSTAVNLVLLLAVLLRTLTT